VPASDCNFTCSFCAIKQRKEANETNLSLNDYVYFLEDVVKHNETAIMAIQGYEPLLPESWPYTEALLNAGKRLGIPTSFVTNGYYLADRAEEIARLNPTGFTVSIDSYIPEKHDKMRGKEGAFDAAINGLKEMAKISNFASKITVSSIMFPNRRNLLEGMPKLLQELGIRHWSAKPVDRIASATEVGGTVDSAANIVRDSIILAEESAKYNIDFCIDDELKSLAANDAYFEHILVRYFDRPEGLIRLAPSGACSVGRDILKEVGPNTPVWNPEDVTPHQFVRSIVPFEGHNSYKRAA
jgi:MoaA/NifB/PqqE/SkfB family radical SAM enzyme